MRRENRVNINDKTNDKIITYVVLGVVAIVAIVIAILISSDNNKKENQYASLSSTANNTNYNTEKTESASSQIGKTVNEVQNQNTTNTTNSTSSNNTNTVNTTRNTTITTTKNSTSGVTTTTTNTNMKEEKEKPTFVKPVDGEIIKAFSKEELAFSETLEEWTTHLGIDIRAEESTEVVAAESGTVKSIKNDPRNGLTIIIEHEDGYQTVYSNLQTLEYVIEGEKIEKGQVIAVVGNTAASEAKEESHLHFEVLKDYEQVNPNDYME